MTIIPFSFAPEIEDAIIQGRKCCTSQHERGGIVGDMFLVRDRLYRIVHIHSCALYSVRNAYYDAEGFSSPGQFQAFWELCYGSFEENKIGYLHFFAYVGPKEMVKIVTSMTDAGDS